MAAFLPAAVRISNPPLMNIVLHAGTYCNARFEVSTAVTMKNAVIWDITQCGSCKN
jgi:hypothetical protein